MDAHQTNQLPRQRSSDTAHPSGRPGLVARIAASKEVKAPQLALAWTIAEPEEVADSIVWLATSKSSYVTGVALPVDGGYLAR
jgi:NAD(P)-dependent dehydrogenase (short-subunit alcohol dehydrogenase family)